MNPEPDKLRDEILTIVQEAARRAAKRVAGPASMALDFFAEEIDRVRTDRNRAAASPPKP